MFFGKLNFDSPNAPSLQDIKGMSGGPIFATKEFGQKLNYWVIGVQSGWYPSIQTISACPFSSLALSLEKELRAIRHESPD